jgi:trk system potassium uptake protein TrkH
MPGRDLPLLVVLIGLAGAAMLLPAAQGFAGGDDRSGRAFLYSGLLVLLLAAMLALAFANRRPREAARMRLGGLVLAYLVLPAVATLPFAAAVPDTRLLDAWFEMVACFTTTGGTLYEAAGRLPMAVHLWRGMVGWLGGLFVLVVAAAILAPMNLGGFEVLTPGAASPDRPLRMPGAGRRDRLPRSLVQARLLFPAYGLLTLLLWLGLIVAGEDAGVALIHAMGTLSTSGISPVSGLEGGDAGFAGEAMVFVFLFFAVTRRSLPGAPRPERGVPLWRDPEVRLAAAFLALVPAALLARHWSAAIEGAAPADLAAAGRAFWGSLFTVLSFLTTTGYESAGWAEARAWSGLEAPGLVLLGLAIMGGGVATTAGGVRLLRVHALYSHARRELERIAHPSSVGGGGPAARALRGAGAYLAFVTFMLFALTLGVIAAALALSGVGFERAVVLAVAGLTTTAQLAGLGIGGGEGFGGLGDAAKIVLAVAMMLGRLEMLAMLALLSPRLWRN